MLLTGHQANYLPYLGFFEKIARADAFVLVDTTQFVKRGPFGWIHRNRIRTDTPQDAESPAKATDGRERGDSHSRDGWMWLSVPVLTHGKFTQSIREALINPQVPWARKHRRSIDWEYRKAPHYDALKPWLDEAYGRPWESLADLNEFLIRRMLETLGIRTPLVRSSDLGATGRKTDLVIDLCRRMKADTYLSGIHGRDYLEKERVAAAGITLKFQEFRHPVYPQVHGGAFIPHLSTLDLLMNCGPRSRAILLGEEPAAPAGATPAAAEPAPDDEEQWE